MKMKIKLRCKDGVWTATVPGMTEVGAGHCSARASSADKAVALAVSRTLQELAQRTERGERSLTGGTLSLETWAKEALFVVVDDEPSGGPFR